VTEPLPALRTGGRGTAPSGPGGALPSARQLLLLRAALGSGETAERALQDWLQDLDLDAVDLASYRLLPLLWSRTRHGGRQLPQAERVRGVYRKAWTRTQVLLHRAAPVVAALRERDIPLLVLKGAALAPRYYPEPGSRFMNDVDLLVPTGRGREARSVLASLGWRPGIRLPETYLDSIHALGYQDGRGGDVDLHWHALWECCNAGDDDALWAAALPMELCGHTVRTLSTTDHLLHVCAHGLRWSDPPAVHWVADAYLLVTRATEPVDWERLVRQARHRHLAPQLRLALGLLRDQLGADVPDAVVRSLADAPAPLWNRAELRARMAPPALHRGLFLHWCDHLRKSDPARPWRRLRDFPRYLCAAWGVPTARQLPRVLAGKILARCRRR